jgi:hypothetical protein
MIEANTIQDLILSIPQAEFCTNWTEGRYWNLSWKSFVCIWMLQTRLLETIAVEVLHLVFQVSAEKPIFIYGLDTDFRNLQSLRHTRDAFASEGGRCLCSAY